MQYLLNGKVSRYCILSLYSSKLLDLWQPQPSGTYYTTWIIGLFYLFPPYQTWAQPISVHTGDLKPHLFIHPSFHITMAFTTHYWICLLNYERIFLFCCDITSRCVIFSPFHPYPAKLIYLNFHPLAVVSRYRKPQLQVSENYRHVLNLRLLIYKYWCLTL